MLINPILDLSLLGCYKYFVIMSVLELCLSRLGLYLWSRAQIYDKINPDHKVKRKNNLGITFFFVSVLLIHSHALYLLY